MIVGVMVVGDSGDGIVVGDSAGGGDQEVCLSIRMCIHVFLGSKIPS